MVLLVISVLLVAWQGSFNMGRIGPSNADQTLIFGAIFLLIFVLMVTLGFILFRELARLYIARQANQPGSRIRTKLVMGALALSCVPVFCLVLFSFEVLSRSVDRWFTNPVERAVHVFVQAATLLRARDAGRNQRPDRAAGGAAGDPAVPGTAAACRRVSWKTSRARRRRSTPPSSPPAAARPAGVLGRAGPRAARRAAAARALPGDGRHAHPRLRGTGRAHAPGRGPPGGAASMATTANGWRCATACATPSACTPW